MDAIIITNASAEEVVKVLDAANYAKFIAVFADKAEDAALRSAGVAARLHMIATDPKLLKGDHHK